MAMWTRAHSQLKTLVKDAKAKAVAAAKVAIGDSSGHDLV